MRLDREKSKPFDRVSGTTYCLQRKMLRDKFFRRFRNVDRVVIETMFLEDAPEILATILESNYVLKGQRTDALIDRITPEGTFTIILGKPRHGKTASAVWLIEELLARGFKVFWFGYSTELGKLFPEIQQTFNLQSIKGPRAVLICDETLLSMFSRDSMTRESKDRVTIFPVAGHHDMAVILLSQSSRIDALLKDLINYIWFKPFNFTSIFEKTLQFPPYIKYLIPANKNENFLYNITTNECLTFSNPLPIKWNDNLSKSWKAIETPEDAQEYARLLSEAGISERELKKFLRQRNVNPEMLDGTDLNLNACPKCHSMETSRWGTRGSEQRWRCANGHIFYTTLE